MKKFAVAGLWILMSTMGATQAFATQVTFVFTSNQIAAAYSSDAYNGTTKTGWLGTYDYGTAGGNGRPANYQGGTAAWQSMGVWFTAAITDFYMRPDSLDAIASATYSVISQTSTASSTFSTRGTSQLPNYLSGTYQNSNSGLGTYIPDATDSNRLFAEYGDTNPSTNPRYGIFASSVSNAALPSEYSQISNVTYTLTLNGNYTAGSNYKFVFYLWGDQLNNGFGGSSWLSPSGGSKDTFLGAISMDLTANTPEPGTFGIIGAGLLAAAVVGRRRRKA